jgi:hypothetical protein
MSTAVAAGTSRGMMTTTNVGAHGSDGQTPVNRAVVEPRATGGRPTIPAASDATPMTETA